MYSNYSTLIGSYRVTISKVLYLKDKNQKIHQKIQVFYLDRLIFEGFYGYVLAQDMFCRFPNMLSRLSLISFSDLPLHINSEMVFRDLVVGRLRVGV